MDLYSSCFPLAGLHGFVDVKYCAGFEAPNKRLTIQEKRESKEWKYYIAAEELLWNYAPNMPDSIDKYDHIHSFDP